MTLWGVLLTSGVWKDPENTHTTFEALAFYITSLYITSLYIDSTFDSIEDYFACMTDTLFLLIILDITTKEELY